MTQHLTVVHIRLLYLCNTLYKKCVLSLRCFLPNERRGYGDTIWLHQKQAYISAQELKNAMFVFKNSTSCKKAYVFIKNSPNPILGAITLSEIETFVCIGVVLHSVQKPGGSYCLQRFAHKLPLVVTFLQ